MEELTFEKALLQLEELITSLEKGELSLEQSIQVYEQGVKLTAFCNKELKTAKLKIEELKAESKSE
ncbi:exodeoxyribonuclease VII small subunit [Paludicola sp. MB14-C6]|uniref:exodeoxyribonuclease VII small subunit n=1 Tax=Paludihabitans sp. MB14-C6 TaxID=3070656 RepID=UPI0027DD2DF7|nr:exodeoxyribonuclease VII small subunit [Paludicola sp. MB14-C6]WMJ23032.1 exodeoxyribonuclease VII small subunit [Paludicola sp. MB14-C6]